MTPGYVPPADPSFEKLFERALSGVNRGGKPVPVLLTLGNHDVASRGECSAGSDETAVGRRKAWRPSSERPALPARSRLL